MNLLNQNLSSRYPSITLPRALLQTNKQQGFTLIELLVVIIIVGILGTIALPQMMKMIGQSREAEATNLMGAMNRSQQGYFYEKSEFATSAVQLEVPIGNEQNYVVFVNQGNSSTVGGLQGAKGIDNQNKGTRDYVAGVGYDPTDRTYSMVICRSIDKNTNYSIVGLGATDTTIGTGTVTAVTGGTQAQCDGSAGVQKLE
ncbi:MAG: type IV pilin-like G/H family protein [Crocosphaera sp.]|nr:type IV pilin-like G/H family protein [Crocosphaera sp.]